MLFLFVPGILKNHQWGEPSNKPRLQFSIKTPLGPYQPHFHSKMLYLGCEMNWLLATLLFLQIGTAMPCTFDRIEEKFPAVIIHKYNVTTMVECLELCYNDKDCYFVDYEKVVCSIFANDVTLQTAKTNTYALVRGLGLKRCPNTVTLHVGKRTLEETFASAESFACVQDGLFNGRCGFVFVAFQFLIA
ncbi:unnamed protein product [Strongylus vulgaris]|uniref:Apple domain-containing protein n=1 Tax=Strongylus vulgaris TaxID=40348 RepID=A0A3P7IGU8_STRVU|nr:unnamed protein product [Strongylus vulgaris]